MYSTFMQIFYIAQFTVITYLTHSVIVYNLTFAGILRYSAILNYSPPIEILN